MSALYYKEINHEKAVFKSAFSCKLPILLKGPTGCGKSRFVESMAHELDLKVITVSCNDETSSIDLLGRYLLVGGETIWQDGPATRAVKEGAILYLDEVAEAREDVITVLHSLSDYRRELFIDRLDKSFKAHDNFSLVVSFNPGYQKSLKEMKPSTRQRFVSLAFEYPEEKVETEIVATESSLPLKDAAKLVKLASKIRSMHELGLVETVSTRLLINAAKLMVNEMQPRLACEVAIVEALSDDLDTTKVLREIVSLII
jgi:nitric oxide reductase NorQ protein